MKSIAFRVVSPAFFLVSGATVAAATFTVTNTNDSGAGSLRAAMEAANGSAGPHTIAFAIGSGAQTIEPLTQLPAVTSPTVIDGRTQPGFSGTPLITIDGNLQRATPDSGRVAALTVTNSSVYDLNVIRTPAGSGIVATNSLVSGCYIGIDRSGTVARANEYGITGSGTFEDNVIVARHTAVSTLGPATIRRNRIGVNAAATAPLGATNFGVYVGAYVSGATLIEENVIGSYTGVYVASGTTIRNNSIGVTAGGTPLPHFDGVVAFGSDNVIRDNRIANSSGAAVYVPLLHRSGVRNRILNNRIEQCAFGIDLAGRGMTPNDAGDADGGPNFTVNYPVLERIIVSNATAQIRGTLSSTPNRTFTIEVYGSDSCTASGYGPGKTRILAFDVTTDGSGHAAFSHDAAGLQPGDVITATATSNADGTSEFSRCVMAEGSGTFRFEHAAASVAETSSSISVTVQRIDGAAGDASVSYATADASARAGLDYTATSGTLSFADGETSATIAVPIVNDVIHEGPQTFTIALSGANAGTPGAVTVTLTDDDVAPVVNVSFPSVNEGDSGTSSLPFVLSLVSPSELPLEFAYETFSYAATAGVDFLQTSGLVTFAAGELEKSVSVPVLGEILWEEDEHVYLTVSRAGWSATARGTIRNDDPRPFVSAANVSVQESDTGTTAVVTLSATQPIGGEVPYIAVPRTARSREDFLPVSGWVAFNNTDTATIEIPIIGDDVVEDHEELEVRFTSLIPYGVPFEIQETPVTVTILNDDYGVGPEKLLVPAGKTRRALIDLGGEAAAEHVFTVTSSDPSVVTVPPTVTVPAGASRATIEVGARVAGRRADVTVTFPAALGGAAHTIRVSTYTEAVLTFAPSELTLYPGQTITVRASLQPANAEPVLIALDGSDTVGVPGSFVIPAGGEGSFEVNALKNGPAMITATLPSDFGSEKFGIGGRVADPPTVPVLHSVSPNNGSTAGGTLVEVHGALFRTDCTVAFGGVPATMVQFVDTETLKTVAPPHAAGAVDVTLHCGTDVAALPNAFLYRGAGPQIATIAPSSGSVAGGTFVRITGFDFISSCWPVFDGTVAPVAALRDANTLDAVVPAHAAGTVDVRLLCTGVDALLSDAFTFTTASDPAPQIANVDPPYGAPGDVVTIAGSGFRPGDAVLFDTSAARVLDATPVSLTIAVPDRAPGAARITMARDAATLASGPLFSVLEPAPPRISRVAPSTVAAGAELVLEGTGIRPSYTFALRGVALVTVVSLPNRAVVRVPADVAPDAYPLEILNASGQLASIGPAVNVTATGIVVENVAPRCGAVDGGTLVTIDGRGFASGATVTFDNVPATDVTVVDGTRIQARVPANYAGAATIAVMNPDGTTSTLSDSFRYASPFDPNGCNSATRMRGVRK